MKTIDTSTRLPSRIPLPEGVREISIGHDVTAAGVTTLVMGWGDAGAAWMLSTTYVPLLAMTSSDSEESGTGYGTAIDLIMRGNPTSAFAVAIALGSDSPEGDQGNVWALFDARRATGVPVGKPKAKAKAPRHYPPIECSSHGLDEDIVLDRDDIKVCSENKTIVSSVALAFISGMPTQEIYRLTCRGLTRTFEVEGEEKFNLRAVHKWMSTPRRRNGCPTNVIDRISRYIDACKDFHYARIGYVD